MAMIDPLAGAGPVGAAIAGAHMLGDFMGHPQQFHNYGHALASGVARGAAIAGTLNAAVVTAQSRYAAAQSLFASVTTGISASILNAVKLVSGYVDTIEGIGAGPIVRSSGLDNFYQDEIYAPARMNSSFRNSLKRFPLDMLGMGDTLGGTGGAGSAGSIPHLPPIVYGRTYKRRRYL